MTNDIHHMKIIIIYHGANNHLNTNGEEIDSRAVILKSSWVKFCSFKEGNASCFKLDLVDNYLLRVDNTNRRCGNEIFKVDGWSGRIDFVE